MEEAFPAARRRATERLEPTNVVTVTTTARLHFGFLDPSGKGSRPFGSFGLSLNRPRTRLSLRKKAAITAVSGPEAERAQRYLATMAAGGRITQPYELRLDEAIPPHAGLGSGTQLALAVGTAFAALEKIALNPAEIAAELGRGARSGIGIATFAQGGLVLDGGPAGSGLPPLTSRVPFPERWRAILIFDEKIAGLSGPDEISAFQTLPCFPEAETEELTQRVQIGLAAVEAHDFAGFCGQVGALQAAMGAYFGALQGGMFVSQGVGEAIGWLRDQGLTGLGQSSWGPTGFAFVPSEAEGQALLAQLQKRASAGLRFELAQGRNQGAEIVTR